VPSPPRTQASLDIPVHTNRIIHHDMKCNTFLKSSVTCACSCRIHYTKDSPVLRSRDSAVSIATGDGLNGWGVGVWLLVGSRIFSSPCHPDRL
jgi:hypothetical protein